MPQLNPHPWFLVFLFMWIPLFIFSPKKILHHITLKNFILDLHPHQTPPWLWPWQ